MAPTSPVSINSTFKKFTVPKGVEQPKPIDVEDITTWMNEVSNGTLDNNKLKKFWPDMVTYFGSHQPESIFLDQTGVLIIVCDACLKPAYGATTKSAYSGAYSICTECLHKFSYCEKCRSYILTSDLGNPTHIHLIDKGNQAYFSHDEEVEPYNADIISMGGRPAWLKTTQELEIWKHSKESHWNIVHPAHSEPKFRYFGIELEVEKIPAAPPDMIKRTRNVFGTYAMIKHDGSLSNKGKNGFEIVTVPATLAYHKGEVWDKFFRHLGEYFVAAPPTTGLHIHVGVDTIGKITAGKMMLFINSPSNREFVESLAERQLGVANPSNGKVYASVNDAWAISSLLTLRQHLPECVWNPNNRKIYSRYVIDSKGYVKKDVAGNPIIASIKSTTITVRPMCRCPEGKYNLNKYEAFRLATQRPTVEIRIFRGIVRQEFLYGALEFADALVNFCTDTSPVKLNYKDFLAWICRYNQSGQTKLYPNLSRLLINKGWIDPPKEKSLGSTKKE